MGIIWDGSHALLWLGHRITYKYALFKQVINKVALWCALTIIGGFFSRFLETLWLTLLYFNFDFGEIIDGDGSHVINIGTMNHIKYTTIIESLPNLPDASILLDNIGSEFLTKSPSLDGPRGFLE
jgi:hypothetical protein